MDFRAVLQTDEYDFIRKNERLDNRMARWGKLAGLYQMKTWMLCCRELSGWGLMRISCMQFLYL